MNLNLNLKNNYILLSYGSKYAYFSRQNNKLFVKSCKKNPAFCHHAYWNFIFNIELILIHLNFFIKDERNTHNREKNSVKRRNYNSVDSSVVMIWDCGFQRWSKYIKTFWELIIIIEQKCHCWKFDSNSNNFNVKNSMYLSSSRQYSILSNFIIIKLFYKYFSLERYLNLLLRN
jgi:hypothetical protein